jgi:hypothetical protein
MGAYPGFIGPSNPIAATSADSERCINWYAEAVQNPSAPTGGVLLPTPGFRPFANMGYVGCRALLDLTNLVYAVFGSTFMRVDASGTPVGINTVVVDPNPATLSYNGPRGGQILITSGGNAYVYTIATNAWAQVVTGTATMGAAKDGRFLVLDSGSGTIRQSKEYDGLTGWSDVTMQFTWNLPDKVQAMVVANDELWLIGESLGAVWYNAGLYPQPFAPIPGATFNYGTRAPFSVKAAADAVVWLSHNKEGAGSVLLTSGYSPSSVSSYAVAQQISRIDTTYGTRDCEVLVYKQNEHTFINVSFPAAQQTWTLDRELNLWHERGHWNLTRDAFDVWSPRINVHAFGKHLVGERGSDRLMEMRADYGLDMDGGPIRRVRVPPPLWGNTRGRISVSRFDVVLDSGLGVPSGQGSAPDIRLRVSLDGGMTWGSERRAPAGRMGQYGLRPAWVALGSSETSWTPEVSVSDPVPYRLSQAFVEGQGIQSTQAPQAVA